MKKNFIKIFIILIAITSAFLVIINYPIYYLIKYAQLDTTVDNLSYIMDTYSIKYIASNKYIASHYNIVNSHIIESAILTLPIVYGPKGKELLDELLETHKNSSSYLLPTIHEAKAAYYNDIQSYNYLVDNYHHSKDGLSYAYNLFSLCQKHKYDICSEIYNKYGIPRYPEKP